jgi:hypothetical protein
VKPQDAVRSVFSIFTCELRIAEAKVIMSAEHKALGFRPPPDSLAAQAQAAAAKHPEAHLDVDPDVLREIARSDAAKITSERVSTSSGAQQAKAGLDLEKVGEGAWFAFCLNRTVLSSHV